MRHCVGAMPGMKLRAGWGLRVGVLVPGTAAGVEGACWRRRARPSSPGYCGSNPAGRRPLSPGPLRAGGDFEAGGGHPPVTAAGPGSAA